MILANDFQRQWREIRDETLQAVEAVSDSARALVRGGSFPSLPIEEEIPMNKVRTRTFRPWLIGVIAGLALALDLVAGYGRLQGVAFRRGVGGGRVDQRSPECGPQAVRVSLRARIAQLGP